MKHCPQCKNKTFHTIFSTEVTFENKEGTLTAVDENNLGHDGIFICSNCEAEYKTSDFDDIIYK